MLSLSDIVNVKVGIGRGVFEAPGATVIGGKKPSFNLEILKLFANGEQGFWYDPNDLSMMYQDAGGTVPVTSVGQPVGLILDKSKGLRIGANLVPQESFAEGITGWILQSGWTLTGGEVVCSGSTSLLLGNTKFVLGKRYRITIVATRTSESGTLSIRNGASSASEIAKAQATGIEVIKRNVLVTDNTSPHIYILSQGWVGEITSISIEEILGNHAYQTTSASRPILRKNPVTGTNYLEFDGTDDSLQTSNIDLTATDKVCVFAGVGRVTSTVSSIYELGNTTSAATGSFHLRTSISAYEFASKGALRTVVLSSSYPAPNTSIITAVGDVPNKVTSIRVNGTPARTNTGDQGASTYGNSPLYIGCRNGTIDPFNGHLYILIGIGRLTTDNETAAIEKELAKRTGVTLNV